MFIHNVGLLGVTVNTGKAKTVTVIDAKLVQVACEPNTLYVVVMVGLAIVTEVFIELKAVDGVQV